MITINSVTEQSSGHEIAAAQALFRRYAEFLRAISACHGFDFKRFREETAALPSPYVGQGGELLLAIEHNAGAAVASGVALGCLGYRAVSASFIASGEHARIASDGPGRPSACELKRLFVLPEARGQQLGHLLVNEALRRAVQHGYRTAILDTEPSSMAAAYRIYTGLGFTEFEPASVSSSGGPNVTYLRRSLR